MRLKVLGSLLALGIATAAVAQDKSPFTFTLKGFVSGSMYVQDNSMGVTNAGGANGNATGQLSLFAANPNRTTDKLVVGGDVRQTRLNFSVTGPQVLGGATPTGVVEIDFFGVLGPGNYGDENLISRIRLGYVETNWGNDILRVGQFHNLITGFIPASAAHIAFPIGYGAGLLGWRSPGVTYLHKMTVGDGLNLELGAQINRNTWNDSAGSTFGAQNVNTPSIAGTPQFQARAMLSSGKTASPWPLYPAADWLVFVAGHLDQKDLSLAGAVAPVGEKDTLTTTAVTFGAKVNAIKGLTLAAEGYYGTNTGNLLGNIVQIGPTAPAVTLTDVSAFGVWGQAGFAFPNTNWSLWGFLGFEHPDWKKAAQVFGVGAGNAARLRNVNSAAMLAYRDGPWVFGLEWFHSFTTLGTWDAATQTVTTFSRNANQFIGTVDFFF